MSLNYLVKESLEGLQRAKASFLLSIATLSFLLIITGIFLTVTVNINRLIEVIHAGIDMEVFIDNALDDSAISTLEDKLKKVPGVMEVEFISKTAAAKIFQEEFGDDVFDILNENPLPSSFKIKLDNENRSVENTRTIAEQIQNLKGVDEVVYRRGILDLLERYSKLALEIDIALGILVGLGSLVIITNTIRLIILAKKNILDAMKLVGATRSFIRTPFLIEGAIQGIIGGLVASGFIYGVVKLLNLEVPGFIVVNVYIYNLMILLGLILGFTGSLIATHRFID